MIDVNDLASSLSGLFICSCAAMTILSNLLGNEKEVIDLNLFPAIIGVCLCGFLACTS